MTNCKTCKKQNEEAQVVPLLLKRCPFCGGEGIPEQLKADNGDIQYFIRCRSCACESGWAKNPLGAMRWWNMRTK